MKKSGFLMVLLFAFWQPAWALSIVPIDQIKPSLSGSWYNPLQSGHGLSVEVMDSDTTVIYWYVYNPDGTPTFLLTVGENQGNVVSGTTYIQTGMKFGEFDTKDYEQTIWGTVTLTFQDCDNAELEYSSDLPEFGSGAIPMTRLASIQGVHCKNSPLQGNYSISHSKWDDDTGSEVVTTGVAILLEDNRMFYSLGTNHPVYGYSASLVGEGSWLTPGDPFENSFEYYATTYSYQGVQQVSGVGTFNEDGFTAWSDTETLTATPLPSYQAGLTIDELTGVRSVAQADVIIGEVEFFSDGSVTGTIDGCQLTGHIEIPDRSFNQAMFDFDLQNCSESGTITGVLTGSGYGLTFIGTSTSGAVYWNM